MLPDVALVTGSGDATATSKFLGKRMAFAVVSPSCGGCAKFLEHLHHGGPDPFDEHLRDFAIVSLGSVEQTAPLLEKAKLPANGQAVVLFDSNAEIMRKWGITTTPGMVIVDEDMRVIRQLFGGKELMEL
ncbi:MAG: redoxin family protein, partial [Candidatus Dormibacteraeota bacterium]|nr:redoxin family protein [Candidatus Dormibacteraeota bacterium]